MRQNPIVNAVVTVLWEKWVEFRFEWKKITASALVSPLLYLIALGWGLGSASAVTERPYIDFLVPGILALTTMNTSFSAVAQPLNVQRLFEHSFDHIIISPTPMPAYIFGQMLGGSLRGMYSGVLILLLSFPFGASMCLSPAFFLVMLLNGMTFGALGVMAAVLASTHADITRFSTFVILPMTFLCNTFFPLDRVPGAVQTLIRLLPLTHASGSLRSMAYGAAPSLLSLGVLALYAAAFLAVANLVVLRRKTLQSDERRHAMRTAVLAVSFGTTHLDALRADIVPVEEALADAFPGCPVYRAFTSGVVRRRLRERQNMHVDSVEEALARNRSDGMGRVVVQPTLLLPGEEYDGLCAALTAADGLEVRAGRPLLYGEDDLDGVIAALRQAYPVGEDTALLLMGHGTAHAANALYEAMARRLRALPGAAVRLCTVEGVPTFEDAAAELAALGRPRALLVPLLLAAGDHAKNDMAGPAPGSLRARLEAAGLRTACVLGGLGRLDGIRALYVRRALQAAGGLD